MKNIGERIKEVRAYNHLTQKAMAQEIFVSASYMSKIESGKEMPTSMLLKLISLQYNVSYEWLVKGTGSMDAKDGYDFFERNNAFSLREGSIDIIEKIASTLKEPTAKKFDPQLYFIISQLFNMFELFEDENEKTVIMALMADSITAYYEMFHNIQSIRTVGKEYIASVSKEVRDCKDAENGLIDSVFDLYIEKMK
ncbi:MAG: helix-turn-helix domain-containing protein [Acutalibacteraceae bacterium]|jgi:transcriptional regulator with XRE-family HTH domain